MCVGKRMYEYMYMCVYIIIVPIMLFLGSNTTINWRGSLKHFKICFCNGCYTMPTHVKILKFQSFLTCFLLCSIVEYRGQIFTHTWVLFTCKTPWVFWEKRKEYGKHISKILQKLISSLVLFFDCLICMYNNARSDCNQSFFLPGDELWSLRLTAMAVSLSQMYRCD